jgi:hypothetical protein
MFSEAAMKSLKIESYQSESSLACFAFQVILGFVPFLENLEGSRVASDAMRSAWRCVLVTGMFDWFRDSPSVNPDDNFGDSDDDNGYENRMLSVRASS